MDQELGPVTSTITSKRLDRWLALEPRDSLGSLALYILAAGLGGGIWYLVIFSFPDTRELVTGLLDLPEPTKRGLTLAALIAACCVVATVFRRPIIRTKPILVPFLAAGLLFLAAGLFLFMRSVIGVVTGEIAVGWDGNTFYRFVTTPLLSVEVAMMVCGMTIPGAILSVVALRIVTRTSRSRASTA